MTARYPLENPMRESQPKRKKRAGKIMAELTRLYPDAKCALAYESPWQLLVATILSAQCTDARVNMVVPALFKRFPTVEAMAKASQTDVEKLVQSTGFFRNKAKNLIACAKALVDQHQGEVPNRLEALVPLPGVGRKTANVVLGNAFGIPGITVDTHVGRLSRRLGLTKHEDPVKVEQDLMELWPAESWTIGCLRVIDHGRAVCDARKPKCESCSLSSMCPKMGIH